MKNTKNELKILMEHATNMHNHLLGIRDFLLNARLHMSDEDELKKADNLIDAAEMHIAHSLGSIMMAIERPLHLIKDNDLIDELDNWTLRKDVNKIMKKNPKATPAYELITHKSGINNDLQSIVFKFTKILDSIKVDECPAFNDTRSILVKGSVIAGRFFAYYKNNIADMNTIIRILNKFTEPYNMTINKNTLLDQISFRSYLDIRRVLLGCKKRAKDSHMNIYTLYLINELLHHTDICVCNAIQLLDIHSVIDMDVIDTTTFGDVMDFINSDDKISQKYLMSHVEYISNYSEPFIPNLMQIALVNVVSDDNPDELELTMPLTYSNTDLGYKLLWYDMVNWIFDTVNKTTDESDDIEKVYDVVLESFEYMLNTNERISKIINAKRIEHTLESDKVKLWN